VQLGRGRRDVVLAGRRLDEQQIGARVGVGTATGDGGGEPVDRRGVGAGDQEEVGVAAGGDGGPDLADHLVDADHGLAAHVPALLGHHLVLQVDPRDAGLLIALHGPHHVDRVTGARVGVGDHRDADGRDDPAGVVDHLRTGQQPHVGPADQRRRGAEARHVDDAEPGLLDEPGREGVVGPRRDDRSRTGQQLAQPGPRCARLT
jgi:hypothetical protein